MDGFWSSLSKWFNEKTGTPLYFTYIGFFIIWNWKFFDLIFLENSSLFTTPKIEYIDSNLYFNVITNGVPIWLINVLNPILNFSYHVLPPAFLTFLSILYLPKIQKWALEKYLDSSFERKQIFAKKQLGYNNWKLSLEKEKEETLGKIAEVKQKQVKQEKIIRQTTSTEEKWIEEFESIKSHPLFLRFREITNIVYRNGGLTHQIINSSWQRIIQPDILAFADTRGLIDITYGSSSQTTEKVSFTEKGKFFVARYLEIIEK